MKTWIVNSNTKSSNNNPNGFLYMLRQNKVSAFYDRAKTIDKISKEDLVLLYHNENRVIAVGAVVNSPEVHDYDDLSVEHWVDVNWLWKDKFNNNQPENPIDRKTLNISMVNNTVVNVTEQVDYRRLIEEVTKRQIFL